MRKEFEVTWEGELCVPPETVWDAVTARSAGWLWEISYEPRVGGAERGLTSAGGTVTAWEPGRHFATYAERDDGWWNAIDYRFAAGRDGRTRMTYTHRTVTDAPSYDA